MPPVGFGPTTSRLASERSVLLSYGGVADSTCGSGNRDMRSLETGPVMGYTAVYAPDLGSLDLRSWVCSSQRQNLALQSQICVPNWRLGPWQARFSGA